jgi:Transglycosylase SLT domain/Inner membrane component of T3SS, cytoplasmic domain
MKEITLIYPTPEGSQEIAIDGEKLSFGRGSDADLRLADDGLSRLNSTIYRDGDNIWIVDENSTNGTFVNGEAVSPSGTPLRNGDSIKVGNFTTLRVKFFEQQAIQAQAASSGQANNSVSVSGAENPSNLLSILPIAVTAFAILVISVSAVFIGIKAFGFGNDTPPIVKNTRNSDDTPKNIDEEETNTEKPTKSRTPKPTNTDNPVNSDSTDVNTSITNSSPTNQSKTTVNLPSGKKYLEMTDSEKSQYVQVKAEKVASLIGSRNDNGITPLAVARIKEWVDGYARRIKVKPQGGCKFGDSLQATYERASKNAPFIVKAFINKQIDPQIGLYLAMIESEHCTCLQSGTGPLGMFQFTYATAKLHFEPNTGIIKGASPGSPDDRCKPEMAANAAASYMKTLTGRYGTGPSSVPLAIASYNSGEGGLSKNMQTALDSDSSLSRDFWALIANSNNLSKQFNSENFKYVPKFFAAAIVGENPQDFGLNLQPLSYNTH